MDFLSEERIASIFRVTIIGEIETTSVVTSNPSMRINTIEAIHSSEKLVLTRAKPRSIPEDGILQVK
jgi:hypothetical protein